MRRISLGIALVFVAVGSATPPLSLAGPATPAIGECRSAAAGERPNTTADDLAECVVARLGKNRNRVTVAFTYASPLGRQNIFLGVDVLAGGNRLKWFGYRPAPITTSGGTASLEVVFGLNNPPAQMITTDQIELFLYVGGGQVFFRKLFNLKLEWQL